ncbi:MAG: universal stress protein [Bacteroidia bacterium]
MKLLVTTDFSENSKGAIRFAHTLAKQSKGIEVVFYHAVHLLKPTRWTDVFYSEYKADEIGRLTIDLKKFVYAAISKKKNKFKSVQFIIDAAKSTEKDIIIYAENNNFDYICIATQGAGMLRKIIGTHTSYIVNNSSIPVMVVPSHYRTKPIKRAVYLSDFENLKKEIKIVTAVSAVTKLKLEVLHYSSLVADAKKIKNNKALFSSDKYKKIKLNIVQTNLDLSLIERVSKFIKKSKPELLILFTSQERSFFESIFLPSKSSELTYSTKVPVLIFPK